jgi:hypothetical protein
MAVRHLFIDDHEIERMDGLRRVVNQPEKHPANPVLGPDRPWENMASVYGTTLFDDVVGRFRMWYLVGCPSDGEFSDEATSALHPLPQTTRVGYAESSDGVTWVKPELGQVEFRGSRANNLLALGRQNAEGISVLVDAHEPDPARRYKALFWDHAADGAWVHPELQRVLWRETEHDGAYLAWSADGIHWTHAPYNPVIEAYMDTSQNLLWDPARQRYVAFSRFGFGRKVARSESADFVNWTQPELVLECDEADGPQAQFYGIAVEIYQGIYIGMVWVYREGTDGTIDTQLASSRDGIHWERVGDRQTFIPLGSPGTWEDGMARAAERVIARGDRLFIYYGGVQGPHTGPRFPKVERTHRPAIGLAVLRRDGFVSLDAGDEEGYALTKAFALPAGALHLNANAAGGSVVAALCSEGGEPLAGFEASRPVRGDKLDATVSWPGGAGPPVGQTVRLRLAARRAKLYAYWLE